MTDIETQVDETTALLIRARGFIERGWCRCQQAVDANGSSTSPTSEDAVAWCASGALIAAGASSVFDPAVQLLHAAIGKTIWIFNDDQETVEPILVAFDRAIAGQRAES